MLVKNRREESHLEDLRETFDTLRSYNMTLNPEKCAFKVTAGKLLRFMVSQRGIEANPDKIWAIMEMAPPRNMKEVQSLNGKIAALNKFVSRATDKCLPFFRTLKKSFEWTTECQQAFEDLKTYLPSPSPPPPRAVAKPFLAWGRAVPLLSDILGGHQCSLSQGRKKGAKARVLRKPSTPRRKRKIPTNGEACLRFSYSNL